MTTTPKKIRNYRATDSTFINVAASKKRHTAVLARLRALEQRIAKLERKAKR